ncbi:MAG: MarR family transcriptional regulator [Angustibacter sp.]
MTSWTFFTNHAHVLLCIWRDPDVRFRDLAEIVGITERAAQRIVADLVADGYLERTKEGRRNRYAVLADRPLRHPVEQPHQIGEVLQVLSSGVVTDRVLVRAPAPGRQK